MHSNLRSFLRQRYHERWRHGERAALKRNCLAGRTRDTQCIAWRYLKPSRPRYSIHEARIGAIGDFLHARAGLPGYRHAKNAVLLDLPGSVDDRSGNFKKELAAWVNKGLGFIATRQALAVYSVPDDELT